MEDATTVKLEIEPAEDFHQPGPELASSVNEIRRMFIALCARPPDQQHVLPALARLLGRAAERQ